MAGSSSLLSLAVMAVLLVGPAAAQGPSLSKSPPSPSPTPQRRLLPSFFKWLPSKSPAKGLTTEDMPNSKGLTTEDTQNPKGITESMLNPKDTPSVPTDDHPLPPPLTPPRGFRPPRPPPPRPPPPRRPGPTPPPPPPRRRRHAPPPPPPVTPGPPPAAARAGSFAALESDAAGQGASSGAVSGCLGFGFVGSVAIGALVAGLVI